MKSSWKIFGYWRLNLSVEWRAPHSTRAVWRQITVHYFSMQRCRRTVQASAGRGRERSWTDMTWRSVPENVHGGLWWVLGRLLMISFPVHVMDSSCVSLGPDWTCAVRWWAGGCKNPIRPCSHARSLPWHSRCVHADCIHTYPHSTHNLCMTCVCSH